MNKEPARPVRDIQAAPMRGPQTAQTGSTALKTVLTILSVIVLVISGIGYTTIGRLGGDLSSASNLQLGGGGGFKDKDAADGAVDILLVGSDSRSDAHGNRLSDEELEKLHAGVDEGEENTDTIMVIRVPNDGSRASAVSIPRDTYISDDEHGNMKINGVYAAHKGAMTNKLQAENDEAEAAGKSAPHDAKEIEQKGVEAGRAALLEEVRDLTGIEIDHYAEIGLLGFVLLTEAVGGVDVCLNESVDDEMSGAKFPAGEQTLHGADALAFVRQRYGLPRGDLDRITRQQAFMASLVNKMLDAGTLTNPAKLGKISEAVERSVVIDENWDVMSFATQLTDLAGGNVTFNTIPVTSVDGTGDYGESIITIDVAEVHKFMDDLARSQEEKDQEKAPAEDSGDAAGAGDAPAHVDGVEVHVLNAGSVSGLAGGVGSFLEGEGYTVARTSNAQPGVYAESQVVAADANDEKAKALAEKLGGLPITVNEGLDDSTLIVVTANEYTGPSDEEAQGPAGEADADADAPVGTPGGDFGTAEVSPEIDAGGNGPRCVN
ncbi:LCP family protein [Corynebacterium confusum]|uniref:LCP family protein n=1 Tax=Corynebacterium confusum TaxID=71254 RepID=UPI003F4941C2|nr:Transcriptional regulator LytR [Corynebacterium confusum]